MNFFRMVGLIASYRKSYAQIRQLVSLVEPGPARALTETRKTPARARQLTADEIQRLVSGYEAGKTMQMLAEEFKVHRTTVAQHLEKSSADRRPRRITTAQVELAARLYEEGQSLVKIGAKLGFNASTIQTHLRRHGIHFRDPHDRLS